MSFWVIFLMARTIPPSFVEIGPKLRVVALLTRQWPKTAKNRGEPQKMTHCSETFFWGWSKWESCSPGYTGDMPCRQKSRFQNKKMTIGPKYPNFQFGNKKFLLFEMNDQLIVSFQKVCVLSQDFMPPSNKQVYPTPITGKLQADFDNRLKASLVKKIIH